MNQELRRANRLKDFIPVLVTVRNGATAPPAGPFSARIINISLSGACLLISPGKTRQANPFNMDARNSSLLVEILRDDSPATSRYQFLARPVWTNSMLVEDLPAFAVGITFLTNPQSGVINSLLERVIAK